MITRICLFSGIHAVLVVQYGGYRYIPVQVLPGCTHTYFLSSAEWSNHPFEATYPLFPHQRAGIVTKHTIHLPHSPHSAQHLLTLCPTSFQRFIPYKRFFVSFEVGPCRIGIRHQKAFRWGGGPPPKKWKNDILGVPRCRTRFRKDVNHLKPASVCTVCEFFILRKKFHHEFFFEIYQKNL